MSGTETDTRDGVGVEAEIGEEIVIVIGTEVETDTGGGGAAPGTETGTDTGTGGVAAETGGEQIHSVIARF